MLITSYKALYLQALSKMLLSYTYRRKTVKEREQKRGRT